MRRRGRVLLFLGAFLAIMAGLLAFVMLQKPAEEVEQPPAMKQVAVAVRDIPMGTVIDQTAVELRDWDADSVPPDAIINVADVKGKYARTQIFTGQIVRAQMIATQREIASEGGLASALVPSGMVAYPFPISELSGVAYALNSGDRVDVLINFRFLDVDKNTQVRLPANTGEGDAIEGAQIPRLVSQLTLQDIEVLKVGTWYKPPELTAEEKEQQQQQGQPIATPPPPAVVTLLMAQQDALVLQYAREAGATVEFALRNPEDHQTVTTESVTLDYVLARFNVTLPIKRDQSLETLSPK